MRKLFYLLLLLVFAIPFNISAQESEIFECTKLIDNQTTTGMMKNSKHFLIYHRFSKIKEISDLYGIYGASNVVLSFDYGITDKWMVGFGTEKYSKMQEFHTKYAIFQQTEGGMPVSLSFYGNTVINAMNEEVWGQNYKFTNRLSYFGQLIIARKLGERIAIQVAPGFSHFNKLDSVYQHDAIAISAGTRVKVTDAFSIIAEYNQGFWIKSPIQNYETEPKPSIGLGFQINTPTHAFQLFVSSYDDIINQKNFGLNQNDFTDGGIMVGFNVTVRF